MPVVLTPNKIADAFTSSFAGAVRDAAGKDGRLSTNEAKNVAQPYRDNAVNYLEKVAQKSVSVDKIIGAAHDYAFATASKAAGKDGRLSAVDVRSLPVDLRADVDKIAPPSANARASEMRSLAPSISLSSFGEDDSGDAVSFVRRKAKVDTLDSDTFLKAFGFSKAKQEASDQYSFQPMTSSDWDNLVDAQNDDAGRAAMQRVREVMEPLGAKQVLLDDRVAFGAPVFVVARGQEGELFGFSAEVGGMGF